MEIINRNLKFTSGAFLGNSKWWLFLCSVIVVVVFYLLGAFLTGLLAIYLNGGVKPDSMSEFLANQPNLIISKVSSNAEFIFGMIGLVIAVKSLHKREIRSLITVKGRLSLKNLFKAALVYFLVNLAVVAVYSYANEHPFHYQLNFQEYYQPFLVSIFVVLIQISFEEFFHRGYLFQNLLLYLKYPLFGLLITSLFFAYIHLNPEYFMMYFIIGLCLGYL